MGFQCALITGASSGIGKALALELAARGCQLALTSRRPEALERVVALARAAGVQAKAYACDVQDRAQVELAARQIRADFPALDLLILSAGVGSSTPMAPFESGPFARVIQTNLLGAVHWIEAVLPSMLAQGSGAIVGISSLAGARGLPGVAAYSASKAALSALLESLRVDLKPHGVRVVTVEPGFVRTPMTAHQKHMPFVWEADRAARIIVRRLEQGRRVIRFPWPMALLVRLMRALPTPLYDALAARGRPSPKRAERH